MDEWLSGHATRKKALIMTHSRLDRVEELLRQEISDIITKDLQDPRIGFITITATKVSPDLRHCKVYFTVYGEEQAGKTALEGLTSAASYIRGEINRRVRLKFIPQLEFVLDERIQRATKVLELLDELERSRKGSSG